MRASEREERESGVDGWWGGRGAGGMYLFKTLSGGGAGGGVTLWGGRGGIITGANSTKTDAKP